MNCRYNEFFSRNEWGRIVKQLEIPPHQKEICQEILSGKSDKQIATALGLQVATIRTHISRLFARLDVQDRVELILFLFRQAHCKGHNGDCNQMRRKRIR